MVTFEVATLHNFCCFRTHHLKANAEEQREHQDLREFLCMASVLHGPILQRRRTGCSGIVPTFHVW